MSGLVGSLEDRFSHDAAHMKHRHPFALILLCFYRLGAKPNGANHLT